MTLLAPGTAPTHSTAHTLPDVSAQETAALPAALDWAGMKVIQMPLLWDDPLSCCPVPAAFDLLVDLPQPGIKGIHMSRLYARLQAMTRASVAPADIAQLLHDVVDSHADCGSTAARLSCSSLLLRPTQALLTPGLQGWAEHRIKVDAQRSDGRFSLWLSVDLLYSSTCPCSAALSRQLIEERFHAEHAGAAALSVEDVAGWIRANGTHATPHSQRSVATVQVALDPRSSWGLSQIITLAETALGTPVQGPVKRADEQEFARRNGQNLMFVEDAARRLLAAQRPHHAAGAIEVRHLESLHPHDAFARVSWHNAGA
ncbi:MAG: GTP cyclohydrolase FolE2 [Stenotrophomonas maltophilia]|uniref:GTP cyclohydrolase FolE2 n=1 Tax=Stenotrophomonas maltophilia TaxID=40324 RepID=A0A7V8JMX0_STEMA|nr:MAG: GTP cyclohydrolase FolE2 [Stenotrophomonas maltophilia]